MLQHGDITVFSQQGSAEHLLMLLKHSTLWITAMWTILCWFIIKLTNFMYWPLFKPLSFFLSKNCSEFSHISIWMFNNCIIPVTLCSSKHLPQIRDFGNVISFISAFDVEGFEGKKQRSIKDQACEMSLLMCSSDRQSQHTMREWKAAGITMVTLREGRWS